MLIAQRRQRAILTLTGMRDEAREELTTLQGAPELLKHSPRHAARLETLLDALAVAIEDMHTAAAVDTGDG